MKRVRAAAAAVLLAAVAMVGAVPGDASAAEDTAAPRLLLRQAVTRLPVADEHREGYDRNHFRHWSDDDQDGCSTRAEVLLEEAVELPEIGRGCVLFGGTWYSAYDDVEIAGARRLDVDHMVPLAEAWDSGAFGWSPQRRADYANDLNDPRSLVAVTAASNRSKSDQDPTTWLPPHEPYRCAYVTHWVTVKTRWSLAVDAAEKTVLRTWADQCPNVPITVQVVPEPR